MTGPKLKVAVLYDVWGDEAAAPEALEQKLSSKKKKKKKPQSKSKREKEDREEIFEALEKLGHEPFYQVLDGTQPCLTALAKCGADLVFNLTEAFAGDDTKEMNVAAYLDLLGIHYTGGGP
ncbi:MAG: D-alanine--D-alanine ligase, partial [Terriglobales bacterium]